MHKIKVWDPFVRLFHWCLVAALIIQFITAENFNNVHVKIGYFITALWMTRLIWGFIGTPYARFKSFIYPPADIFGYLIGLFRGRPKHYIGHNPAGGAMIVALLLSLLLTTSTGLLAYGAVGAGPLSGILPVSFGYGSEWMEELHEFFANFTLLLVVIHVGGVAFESLLHKENLVRSMFTGTKRA